MFQDLAPTPLLLAPEALAAGQDRADPEHLATSRDEEELVLREVTMLILSLLVSNTDVCDPCAAEAPPCVDYLGMQINDDPAAHPRFGPGIRVGVSTLLGPCRWKGY